MKVQQSLPHRLCDAPSHFPFLMKFYLSFGWVDVHIDRRWVDFQEQTTDGISSLHQRGVISLQQCEIQPAVFDGTTIYKKMLVFAGRAGNARRADKAPN